MYAIFLYRIEMYIVGGFLDSRNISEDVFMQILRKYIFVILETLKAWRRLYKTLSHFFNHYFVVK